MAKPDLRSAEAQRYRKLYKTARWQRTRGATLLRDNYLCQWCKKRGHITIATVCHHEDKDSKADPATFFEGPFVSLCAPCHDGDAQSLERDGKVKPIIGVDGWPIE